VSEGDYIPTGADIVIGQWCAVSAKTQSGVILAARVHAAKAKGRQEAGAHRSPPAKSQVKGCAETIIATTLRCRSSMDG
jgi:hypothetical protein